MCSYSWKPGFLQCRKIQIQDRDRQETTLWGGLKFEIEGMNWLFHIYQYRLSVYVCFSSLSTVFWTVRSNYTPVIMSTPSTKVSFSDIMPHSEKPTFPWRNSWFQDCDEEDDIFLCRNIRMYSNDRSINLAWRLSWLKLEKFKQTEIKTVIVYKPLNKIEIHESLLIVYSRQ